MTGQKSAEIIVTVIVNRGDVDDAVSKLRNPQARPYGKDRTNIGEPTRAPSRNPNRRRAL